MINWKKIATDSAVIGIVLTGYVIQSTPAQAGCYLFGDKSSCGRDASNSGKDVIRRADETFRGFDKQVLRPIADQLRIGWESAADICSKVGVQKCTDAQFIQAYQAIRVASFSNVGMIKNANECGAAVMTVVKGGTLGVKAYAMYNGVDIPQPILQMGANRAREHGYDACYVVHGSYGNYSNHVRTSEGAVVRKAVHERYISQRRNDSLNRQNINQVRSNNFDSNTTTRKTTSSKTNNINLNRRNNSTVQKNSVTEKKDQYNWSW